MKKYAYNILFGLCLLSVALFYNYHEIVQKRPESTHRWRQSDCASLALNYYQGGMDFFHPETHNLTSEAGTSGKACPSEIPFLYYSVAILYHFFGYHELIYRVLNTLLFFIGLFYLFRLSRYLLKDTFWSVSLVLLLFSSPVLVYYANSFLSNTGALAFAFAAWYFFIRYYHEKKMKLFFYMVLFLFLAASFKISALFSLFVIGALLLLEITGIVVFPHKIFKKPMLQFALLTGAFVVVASWAVYAYQFNQRYDCTYFSTNIFPIWNLDKESINSILDKIINRWGLHYFSQYAYGVLVLSIILLLAFLRKNLKVLNLALLLLFVQFVVYILLQFWTFADHDYYTIDLYIFMPLLVLSTLYVLKEKYPKVFRSIWVKILFFTAVIFSMFHAREMNEKRYGEMNERADIIDSYTVTKHLRQMGIQESDTIVSIPDKSNVSLYLMNQRGWTQYTDARFNKGEPIPYNSDSVAIQSSIEKGAKYMMVQGIKELYSQEFLRSFCTHLKGTFNDMLVFDLQAEEVNFELNKKEILHKKNCGAENRSGNLFISMPDSIVFRNGETQTKENAFSGLYAIKLYNESRYGMTISLDKLRFGESVEISVWRKSIGDGRGEIIVSGENFYQNKFKVVKKDPNGWEKISLEFFVTKDLEGKTLGTYLYNSHNDPVYFDEFTIIRYKSVFNEI